MTKQYWKDYSFVMRSKQRKMVIVVIDRPMTVTEIKKKTKLSLSETSRVLRGFKEQGLVICINEKDPLGRICKLTKRGEIIRKELKKLKLI